MPATYALPVRRLARRVQALRGDRQGCGLLGTSLSLQTLLKQQYLPASYRLPYN